MCQADTVKTRGLRKLSTLLLLAYVTLATNAWSQVQPDWRRVGNALVERGLASPAGGPVDRVWYATGDSRLFVRTGDGRVLGTTDFESWQPVNSAEPPPAVEPASRVRMPEAGARVRMSAGSRILYAIGRAAYRSEDGGATWRNLTEFRGQSLLGPGLTDLAVSPREINEIVASGRMGVWRSVDGGLSWSGINDGLPNLPVRRIARVPGNGAPARIELVAEADPVEAEWEGQATGWVVKPGGLGAVERQLRAAISTILEAPVSAIAVNGDTIYGGGEQGRLWVSADGGQNWRGFRLPESGAVTAIWVHPTSPQLALATLSAPDNGVGGVRVARTINGGVFWDDLTANLDGGAYGITADAGTGAVYVATSTGVFLTYADLVAAGPATAWVALRGRLPEGAARDVRLDEGGNQLWVAMEGHGLFAALAPHRFRDPRVVNAADHSMRAAAPGALLSVLGSRVSQARAGVLELPVLSATDTGSQIQVPFEATGDSLRLALQGAGADGSITLREVALALQAVSPAIFVDKDGAPMLLDADRGLLLDYGTPARAGSRIQILATGLGKVVPDWPTGLAAPLENPPSVLAPVRVYLDRAPLEVTRATLAPGYVGFYLIEVQLPEIVNGGPAELYVEAGAASSGRVSLLLTQ